MAIDPIIKKKANDIRTKIYGKEVREDMASGLETMSGQVVEINDRQNTVEAQFQQVIDETTGKDFTSAPEIVAARGAHPNLSQRLISTDQQLAEKANSSFVNDKFDSVGSLSPKEVFLTLSQLNLALPTGANGVYLTQDDGNWRYWSEGQWKVGGAYQGNGIGKKSITADMLKNDSLSISLLKEKMELSNLFNKRLAIEGYTLYQNGNVIEAAGRFVTDFIKLKPSTFYHSNLSMKLLYDSDFNLIGVANETNSYDFKTTAKTAYMRGTLNLTVLNNAYVVEGSAPPTNTDYSYTLEGFVLPEKEYEKIEKDFSDIEVKDNLKDIQIKQNATSLEISIKGNAVNKITFYAYQKGKQFKFIKTVEEKRSFTLNQWDSLIWNLTSNELEIKKDAVAFPKEYVLMANYGGNSVSGEGYLIDRHSAIKNTLPVGLNDHIKVEEFYCYEDNPTYIKFKTILVTRGSFYKQYTWEKFYTDLIAFKGNSPQWLNNCIRVNEGFQITLNTLTDTFIMNTLGNSFTDEHILLCWNDNKTLGGLLAQKWKSDMMKRQYPQSNTIPLDWLKRIEEKENEVLELSNENSFLFGLATDLHVQEWERGYLNTCLTILNRASKTLNVDTILNAGDGISYGRPSKYTGLGALKDVMNKLDRKKDLLFAFGNHDTNIISDPLVPLSDKKQRPEWILQPNEIERVLCEHLGDEVVWGSKKGMYYYKDFEDKKIRIVVLNTSDVPYTTETDANGSYYKYISTRINGVRQEQMDWFANTALILNKPDKNEWHTIIMFHIGLYTQNEGFTWNEPAKGSSVLKSIIANFVSGTSNTETFSDTVHDGVFNMSVNTNFASQGPSNLIGVFSGHNHLDCHLFNDGFNSITTTCGYPDPAISSSGKGVRTPFEYSEFAFDIVIVDKENRTVKMKRFGGGEDRTYTY